MKKALRKTKIICTIGPSTNTEEKLSQLIDAGMNVARINMSHSSPERAIDLVNRIKKVRQEKDAPLGLLLDTKGPEVRVKSFKDEAVQLKDGQKFTLVADDIDGTEDKVSITYSDLYKDMNAGDIILANDGLIKLQVEGVDGTNIVCEVLVGGQLSNNKSLNFPNKTLGFDYVSEKDKADLIFAAENDFDFIACSFVSCAQDMKDVKAIVDEHGGQDIELLAKIENQSGVDNITEILDECAGIFVARGDLGVEVDFQDLPEIQKYLLKICRTMGKCGIVCTEMLESMINNPRPTRAEISDVANAILDGAQAIMLSGETATGKHPVETVQTMNDIARATEKSSMQYSRVSRVPVTVNDSIDAIAHAACTIAMDVNADVIAVYTESGWTAKLIANFRNKVDVVAVAGSTKVYNKLSMYWGITPVAAKHASNYVDVHNLFKQTCDRVFASSDGLKVVYCTNYHDDEIGDTNFLKIDTL